MSGFQAGLSPADCRAQLGNFERDARLNPANAQCVGNYAAALFTIGRVNESIPLFDRAYQLDPSNAATVVNRAMAYKECGRFDDCARELEFAHASEAGSSYAALGYAESLLRAGFWSKAWPLYEQARYTKFITKNEQQVPAGCLELTRESIEMLDECGQQATTLPDGTKPMIAVYGEGGIGDRICYARFLPWLAKYGFDFTYFPDAGIVNNPGFACASLFSRAPWAHAAELRPLEAAAWCTQFSLCAIFDVTPTRIPDFPEPLPPDPETAKMFRGAFDAMRKDRPKPIIGVVWSAGEKFEGERKFRSMTEGQVARLAVSCPEYNWINCLTGTHLPEPWIEVNPFTTWEHTAGILASCDGIITVDTGPMHLAGWMKLPMWIALSGNSDWKFLKPLRRSVSNGVPVLEPWQPKIAARAEVKDRCYWYRHAKIFRNEGIGFESTINQLIARLNAGDFPGREKYGGRNDLG
jgi:hypothetical protein